MNWNGQLSRKNAVDPHPTGIRLLLREVEERHSTEIEIEVAPAYGW